MSEPWFKSHVLELIAKKGGWINCHAHLDRAYTVTADSLTLAQKRMEQKWTLVDDLKKHTTEEQYEARIEQGIRMLVAQGVRATCTFIDVDSLTELRALKAAVKIREKYKGTITILLINQVLRGLTDSTERHWAEQSLPYIDIIGGLPSKDRPEHDKHLDTLFGWARDTGKMLHVHIDQENNPDENDTELLATKTIREGLSGKVVAVHAISVAAQSDQKRKHTINLLKEAGITVVCCPSAALSMQQLDTKESRLHNSIAPVTELVQAGVSVALGVDNISDIYQPMVDGDMYTELRMLAESCRLYDPEVLSDIATRNGAHALGLL